MTNPQCIDCGREIPIGKDIPIFGRCLRCHVKAVDRGVFASQPFEPNEQLQLDKARLDWWQAQHTLHNSLQLVYVVDSYELEINVEDGDRVAACYAGKDIRACIDAAMGFGERKGNQP